MRNLCAAVVVTLFLAGGTTADIRVVQATDSAEGLAVITASGSTWIEQAGVVTFIADLPPGTHITSLTETESGWIAAGSRPGARGSDLLLLEQSHGEIRSLHAPQGREKAHRGSPATLVEGKRLVGLAWLEGDRQNELTVRAARRIADDWGPLEVVADEGAGSQVALAGAVLRDGSWLLVWTAFDGTDDEIVWSRGSREGWSAPQAVHADNAVPDILPAVAAHGEGAVVAWSAYDGSDYRLHVAHFLNPSWEELAYESEAGSHLAGFVRSGGELFLLYKTTLPEAWSLLALYPRGRVVRRASVAAVGAHRPILRRSAGDRSRILLAWPGGTAGESERREPVNWSPRR